MEVESVANKSTNETVTVTMKEGNEDPSTSKLLYGNYAKLKQSTQAADYVDVEGAAANTTSNAQTMEPLSQGETETTTHHPPDVSFLCGLAEPIDTSPSNFPVDLASLATVLATETRIHTSPSPSSSSSSSSCCGITSFAIQLAAIGAVWIKILLLSSILIDSMTPRCTSNEQCKPGLFCFPLNIAYDTDWPTETRGNSICNDCLFSNFFNATDFPGAEEFLEQGREYCINDDPDRCDFLQANRGKYSYLSFVVLCCLCGMFARMIYLDLHKLHVQQKLYDHRFGLMKTKLTTRRQITGTARALGTIRVFVTGFLNWFAYASRAFILPSWMFTGAALLLTTWAPTTRNLLLVPIQIGLIANFDMVLEFVLVRESHKEYTKNAARALDLHDQHHTYDKVLAVLIRLYSFGLAIQIPIFVLLAESIYPMVSFITSVVGQNSKYTVSIPIPCTDVLAAGIFFPMLLSVPMTLLIGPVANRLQYTPLHLLGYVSTFVLVLYSCFWVREIITFLQFQSF